MLSGKFTGLLNVFLLLLALTRIHSAVSADAAKTKFAGTVEFGKDDTSKEIDLGSEINFCDPTTGSASSFTFCFPQAENALNKITVTIGDKNLEITRTPAGSETPCFTADACNLFTINCPKATKLSVGVSSLTAAASVPYLISGRELKKYDDVFNADSATSVYIASSAGQCTSQDPITWKYVTKTQAGYVCGDAADNAIGMVASYLKSPLKMLTTRDADKDDIGQNVVTLQCTAPSPASTTTLKPNTTTTSSDAVDRLGSISVMLAAATVSTFGVMAFSG